MSRIALVNARLGVPPDPEADALLVEGNRIAWVGRSADAARMQADRVMDCLGSTVLPGLHDGHIHFLAYAASLRDLDCRGARSIGDLQRLARERAAVTPPGGWVRGRGFDETSLVEGRFPTRADLDAAAPGHPVRLDHRSGHASVLNSVALKRVSIAPDTPDPPEGVIERDDHGVPMGVLFEMGGYLSQRIGEARTPQEQRTAIAEASDALLGWGITSFEDATPENAPARWEAFRRYQAEGLLKQRVTLMLGIAHVEAFASQGLRYGDAYSAHGELRQESRVLGPVEPHERPWLRMGHAKIVVTLTTGGLYPDQQALADMVRTAHDLGFPVAIHAVEEEAILAVVEVLRAQTQTLDLSPGFRTRASDRIEHCSEATPAVLAALKGAGVAVCTNPSFLYESGPRYRATAPPEVLPWLYPLRSLLEAGVPLLAGSDAPVASPDPWQAVYAAVTRRDATGQALHPEQGVSLEQALALFRPTHGELVEPHGRDLIAVGDAADLVVLDRDMSRAGADGLLGTRAAYGMVGGAVVWGEGG